MASPSSLLSLLLTFILPALVVFGFWLVVGLAVARWWLLGVPLALGVVVGATMAIGGTGLGDTATWFSIVLLIPGVLVAEVGAGAGVFLRQGFRGRFAWPFGPRPS